VTETCLREQFLGLGGGALSGVPMAAGGSRDRGGDEPRPVAPGATPALGRGLAAEAAPGWPAGREGGAAPAGDMQEAAGLSLYVIVAAQDARATIAECLAAIAPQLAPGDGLLVADASRDGTAALVRREFPAVDLLIRPPGTLIPQLWRDAIGRCGERDAVVLTTAHCVPSRGWLAALRATLAAGGTAAVGGPIEPSPPMGAVDWAIYLQRYSSYLAPVPAGAVDDPAGDNAAYRRDALGPVADTFATGFWEPFVHAALRRRGLRLTFAPEAVVSYRHAYGATAFCAQRFRHGRHFGALRAASESGPRRALRAASGPLVPVIWLWRIACRLRARRRFGREFARALPLLVLFLSCWAAGEAAGTLVGAPAARR
jgi:hypothetical protein